MNKNIQPKEVLKTANSIGYTITFVADNQAQVNYSLNDEHGYSIDSGTETFTGTFVAEIEQKLFTKLNIIPNE